MADVVINAMLAAPDAHGIGQYARMLVEAVAKFTPSRSILALSSGEWSPQGIQTLRLAASSSRRHRLPAENLRIPWLLKRRYGRKPVVFHNLDYGMSPMIPRTAINIVTVHDVAFVEHPEFYGSLNAQYKYRRFMVAARRADVVVTDSENVRSKIGALVPFAADKTRVLYPGIDPMFSFEETSSRADRARIGYLGQLTARKNLETLVRAFGQIGARTDAELWLAGMKGLGWERIEAEIEALPRHIRDRVHVPGRLARADVAPFLRSLTAFVFPSWAEGFGFPPVEAMACGTPVIVSDAGSLPEVVGDAGLVFDPQDESQLADLMLNLVTDRTLSEGLIARGLARAADFSWQRFADSLTSLYEGVNS